jgi:hypothetical protein
MYMSMDICMSARTLSAGTQVTLSATRIFVIIGSRRSAHGLRLQAARPSTTCRVVILIVAKNGATTTATTIVTDRKARGQTISSPLTSFLSKYKYTSDIRI